jgi:hypothetical protein
MKLTKRSKRQADGLIKIVAEAYDVEISRSQATTALINYGFECFLTNLPDVKFLNEEPDKRIDFSVEK